MRQPREPLPSLHHRCATASTDGVRSSFGLLCDSQRQVPRPLGGLVSAATSQPPPPTSAGLWDCPLCPEPEAHIPLQIPASHNISLESVRFKAESSWCRHVLLCTLLWEDCYPTWTPQSKIYALLIFSHEILDCRFFKFSFSLKKNFFFYMYLLRSGTSGGQRSTARMSAGDGTQVLRLKPQSLHS